MHLDEHTLVRKVYMMNYSQTHIYCIHAPHSSAHTDINLLRQPKQTGLFSHLNPSYNSHTRTPENLFPKTEQARGRPVEER